MYIKNIKVQGFKSFADKVDLHLNPGMTAIVGPNGSGKSNIVDAILWVLGEQSVKSLRGDGQMSDVIFSGSKTRDELKKASVAITFDNSDHSLNTNFTEVEIKRTIYKTGENEYFINNAKVRLKDITDILTDVTSKFNIISQGNINALVENKSSERRTLFESAASVLKYKKRKEEALKKLGGTEENLTRINLIIKELSLSLNPLEKQKKDAENYLQIKKELKNTEIALLGSEITTINEKYQELKNENTNLQNDIDKIALNNNSDIEKLKVANIKYDEELKKLNLEINQLVNEIADLEAQKRINLERLKYTFDKNTINLNLIELQNKNSDIERELNTLNNKITSLKDQLKELNNDYSLKSEEKLKTQIKINTLNNESMKLKQEKLELENRIKIENHNLETNAFLPKSVASILNNPRLLGIHNTISNLIKINDLHQIAIKTALGSSANFIIVDDFASAQYAIQYLKENKLGRATFLPLNIMKSRRLEKTIENELANNEGFIGLASDIIKYDEKYQNVIENQLGNIIIVDTLDNINKIAKKINYKYRLVSLDGEEIFPGGSIAGGSNGNFNFSKNNLIKLNSELNKIKIKIEANEASLRSENNKFELLNKSLGEDSAKIIELKIQIDNLNTQITNVQKEYEKNLDEINSLKNMDNDTSDTYINDIIKNLNEKINEKEIKENEELKINTLKLENNEKIQDLEKERQEQNTYLHKLEGKLNSNNIELGKYEVRLDSALQILTTEYNITYEYAINNYPLELDINIAREIVTNLKNKLKGLNNINLGSIDEYERIKTRYDFLEKQKIDLETSSQELNDIIEEMDTIMQEKFKTTFDKIATEFSKVFKIMFKGGTGTLKLENEDDLLNTGINILAIPPGKKLNSTASLSGGEKALTAICLIFAILNVKPAPFIILDEAEAALDEENVNMFGEYLNNMKNTSQFILITHKKRMMEYADVLFGVTMQESGISKLVSVRLEDKN